MLTISGETEHVPNIFVYLLYPHLHYAAISMYAMQLFKYVDAWQGWNKAIRFAYTTFAMLEIGKMRKLFYINTDVAPIVSAIIVPDVCIIAKTHTHTHTPKKAIHRHTHTLIESNP